ncbi:hypothetical protein NPIL_602371 [Nephila pilipes]|uniref:Uncharacterized protein n=1 Tax=Nephila pilipes TaxID=299642 RepID=A0A8X6U637_NEPPI|nr:hypothetical protein NPIL_602371 [Nephila pilipes]
MASDAYRKRMMLCFGAYRMREEVGMESSPPEKKNIGVPSISRRNSVRDLKPVQQDACPDYQIFHVSFSNIRGLSPD